MDTKAIFLVIKTQVQAFRQYFSSRCVNIICGYLQEQLLQRDQTRIKRNSEKTRSKHSRHKTPKLDLTCFPPKVEQVKCSNLVETKVRNIDLSSGKLNFPLQCPRS